MNMNLIKFLEKKEDKFSKVKEFMRKRGEKNGREF